jgi:hypothetical protein
MIRSLLTVASAVLVVGTVTTSADAQTVYLRTSVTASGSTELYTYPSLPDLAANTNGQLLGQTTTVKPTDGFWTDGLYVYKTTKTADINYNNAFVRYANLVDLASDTNGTLLPFNGRGMYFNEEVVAKTGDGGNGTPWYFRTNGGDGGVGSGLQDGLAAANSFSDLLNNNHFYVSGFTGGTQNGGNKYWGSGGIDNSPRCYSTVVVNGVVTAFRIYLNGPNMFNNSPSEVITSAAGYGDDDNFIMIDSALVQAPPPPTCPGDIDGDGVVAGSDLATLLSNWGVCRQP